MAKKQQNSTLQRALIKQRLSEKDAQVQELLKTVSEMFDSMGQLKKQIAKVKQGIEQSLHSGPMLAVGILDEGSATTVPRMPSGWVGIGGNANPLDSIPPSAPDTQFVNVEVLMYDTAYIPLVSRSMEGHIVEAIVMQGIGGLQSSDPNQQLW